MTGISLLDYQHKSRLFSRVPFFCDGVEVKGAFWGMTFLNAKSMRFRWNEKNLNRDNFFTKYFPERVISSVELVHSQRIIESNVEGDTHAIFADGIATINKKIVPVVTVADCVPIFLYDRKTGAKMVLHSGWKGTGIAKNGVEFLRTNFGAKTEDIFVAIGAHICEECYEVDENRRAFFLSNFGKSSVNGKCLSLLNANLFVLKESGVLDRNITVATDCTCCTISSGSFAFGSFRREAAHLPNASLQEKSLAMTVQAAFVCSD